jgi:hypothetical protein
MSTQPKIVLVTLSRRYNIPPAQVSNTYPFRNNGRTTSVWPKTSNQAHIEAVRADTITKSFVLNNASIFT